MSSSGRSPKKIIDDFAKLFVDVNSRANINWSGVPIGTREAAYFLSGWLFNED